MKSDLPKGMHRVCGAPILEYIVRAMVELGIEKPILVVGHGGDSIVQYFGERCQYVWQTEQLGTGHAAQMAAPLLPRDETTVLLTPGDTPLLEAIHLRQLLTKHQSVNASATVASFLLDDPTGYGRVVRGPSGEVTGIVEHKDATDEERTIQEVNSAVYAFAASDLLSALQCLKSDNAQGEFYLTDVIRDLSSQDRTVQSEVVSPPDAFRGVNDRWQLAEAAELKQKAILRRHAESGVTIADPRSTFIELDVAIGRDSIVLPNTTLEGKTTIGERCEIGPNTRIQDSQIGNEVEVLMSHLRKARMADGTRCGPFANLRPGADLGPKAKVGNFVEIKNAKLHEAVSVSHLSYIGDGEVGPRTNIGAGTIFCNYDGFTKSRTTIGADAFIGSNSTLVAPVTIGDGAMIAAGSVITKSVPGGALSLGRARQESKEGWAIRWRAQKAEEKKS